MVSEDKGRLNYRIRVEDQFTAPIRKFREELLKAKSTIQEVQTANLSLRAPPAARGGANSEAAEVRKAAKEKAAAAKAERAEELKRLRTLSANSKILDKEQKFRVAQIKDEAAERARLTKIADSAAKAEVRAAKAAEQSAKKAQQGLRGTRLEAEKTESAINRVSFTFRRLFGILAAFALARQAGAGFAGLIAGGIEFNRVVEDSQAGLAGVFSATGKITDAQGRVLQGAEAFTAAQKEAVRQQALLRQDALATTATFQELVETFQVATGPGLEAGLNLDQIRQLAVRVSQAAASLGIAQNMLSEEIRSLLTGTGTVKNSRIFAVLFGSNEELKRAKESGKLFDILSTKLAAFGIAGEAVQQTFTGLLNRLRESIQVASGLASVDLFKSLKQSMSDIADLFVEVKRNASGVIVAIEPKPAVVAALKQVFDFLDDIKGIVTTAFSSVSVSSFQAGLADVLTVLRAVFVLAGSFAAGFAAGVRDILAVLAPFAKMISEIGPLLALFIRIRVTISAIQAISGRIVGLFALWKTQATVITAQMTAAELSALRTERNTRAVALGIGAAALAAVPLISSMFDVELSLERSSRIVGLALVNGIQDMGTEFEVAFSKASEFFGLLNKEVRDQKGIVATVAEDIGRFGAAFDAGILDLVGAEESAQAMRDRISKGLLKDDAILEKAGVDRVTREHALRERLRADQAQREKKFAEDIGAILAEGVAGEGLKDKLDARVKEIEALIKKTREAAEIPPDTTVGSRDSQIDRDRKDKLDVKQREVALLQAELNLRRVIVAVDKARLAPAIANLRVAEAEKASLNNRLQITKAGNALDLARLAEANKQLRGAEAIAFGQQELNALKAEQLAIEEDLAIQAEQAAIAAERAREIAEGSASAGVSRGFIEAANAFPTAFQSGIAIAKNALNSFVDLASSAIVDAFDPTKDASLRERFAQFLQGIARDVIKMLLQIALKKAILGLAGLFGGGDPTGATGNAVAAIGFAEGGEIPGGHGVKRGRPAGLDPRDTTPIWAQPGEFMHPLRAVAKYGMDVMESIRAGLIDPTALRELAGLGSHRQLRRKTKNGAGFVTGGAVPAPIRTAERAAARRTAPESSDQPAIALVAGNEQSMDRLLAGGKRAMLDFIRANGPAIDGMLKSQRSS